MSQRYPGGIITKTPVTPSGPYGTNTAPGIWTLDQALQAQRAGNWPVPGGPFDLYFEYVTMLLHGDGTNGGQNNTFLDSSTNNFSITRNGNTTQGSFSPYGTLWSNYFDGTTDYLTTSASSNFGMGTGTFSFECWIFPTANPANGIGTIFDARSGANAEGWVVRAFADRTIGLYNGPSNAYVYSTGTVTLNQWNHIAVVRSSTSSGGVAFYINGAAAGTATVSSDLGTSWSALIASNYTAGFDFNGYISNLRVVKGAVVYSAAFTPSTNPLTTFGSGTNALLTCQSNRFVDNSGNSLTVTPTGNTSVQRFSPFSPTAEYSTATIGGSGYFDGSGDYLSVANNSNLDLGSGDFTLECWFYATNANGILWSQWNNGGNNAAYLYLNGTNFQYRIGGTTYSFGSFKINNWTHVAVSRSGSSVYLFVNGELISTQTNSTNITTTGATVLGANDTGTTAANFFAGYIGSFRQVKGTAVYTSSFTPPSAPLTAVTNTQLLTNFTNAAVFDNAMICNIETVGNAQISTSVVKYGTGSLRNSATTTGSGFKGITNGLFLNGDFTIEWWAYHDNLNTGSNHVMLGPWGINSSPILVRIDNGATLQIYMANTGPHVSVAVGSTGITATTWQHYAITRSSGTNRFFVSGTQVGSSWSLSTALNFTLVSLMSENAGTSTTADQMPGYMDDVRITNGIARYTANFTPPTAAFPNQ